MTEDEERLNQLLMQEVGDDLTVLQSKLHDERLRVVLAPELTVLAIGGPQANAPWQYVITEDRVVTFVLNTWDDFVSRLVRQMPQHIQTDGE